MATAMWISSSPTLAPRFLYRNNRNGTFTEVSREAGIQTEKSFATWFFDYDNDGWPDLFVTSYFTSVDETARTYLGMPPMPPRCCFTGIWATANSRM